MIKKNINRQEELNLIKEYRNGSKQALESLIKAHNKFIISVANSVTPEHLKSDKEAVCQEGRIGLIRAIDKFDINSGRALLTYARPWICGEMKRFIQSNRNIAIPAYVFENLKKVNDFKLKFLKENFRDPSPEEISEELNMKVNEITNMIIESQNTYSTDFIYNNDTTPESLFEESSSNIFEKDVERDDCISKIMSIVKDSLNDKEKQIVIDRYGFNGNAVTLEDIGNMHKISKERVRQISEKILKKFRIKSNREKLEIYSNGNGLLKSLNSLYQEYRDIKESHSYVSYISTMIFINNSNNSIIFDIIMMNALTDLFDVKDKLVRFINNEKKENGSNKVKCFLESLNIKYEKL